MTKRVTNTLLLLRPPRQTSECDTQTHGVRKLFFFSRSKVTNRARQFHQFFCFLFFIRGEYREHCRREGCWETASISVTALFLTKQSDSIQQQFSERKHAEIWALSPAYHWHLWSLTLSLSLSLSLLPCALYVPFVFFLFLWHASSSNSGCISRNVVHGSHANLASSLFFFFSYPG